MIGRLPGVLNVQDVGTVPSINVYRSPLVPTINTSGLSVDASSLGLPPASLSTSVAQGSYLNAASARAPVAVLGAGATQPLGIDRMWPGERIWLGGMWYYVADIINPAVLTPGSTPQYSSATPRPRSTSGSTATPPRSTSEIYVRAQSSQVDTVDNLLAAQADSESPSQASPSVPSAALVAQADAQGAFNYLFLGVGAVALLIGAAAGILPAIRAARLSPTQALWSF